jgi:hypothetical protein
MTPATWNVFSAADIFMASRGRMQVKKTEGTTMKERDYQILKDRRQICGSYNGADKAIKYLLVFRVLPDPYEGDVFDNCIPNYREIKVYLSEGEIENDERESMDAILSGKSFQDLLSLPDRKISALVSNDWLCPLHGFLQRSKKDPQVYIFREYFHNDAIVNATMDAIPNAWCASEVYRLLTILSYCWD